MKRDIGRMTILGLLLTSVGCGSGTTDTGPRLNIVTGHISFAQKKSNIDLADHSIVEFHPKEGAAVGQKISGPVIEGVYSLFTEEGGDKIVGAPEGDYVVTITPSKTHPSAIPAKYRDPKTSDLSAYVESGFNTDVDFELTP